MSVPYTPPRELGPNRADGSAVAIIKHTAIVQLAKWFTANVHWCWLLWLPGALRRSLSLARTAPPPYLLPAPHEGAQLLARTPASLPGPGNVKNKRTSQQPCPGALSLLLHHSMRHAVPTNTIRSTWARNTTPPIRFEKNASFLSDYREVHGRPNVVPPVVTLFSSTSRYTNATLPIAMCRRNRSIASLSVCRPIHVSGRFS